MASRSHGSSGDAIEGNDSICRTAFYRPIDLPINAMLAGASRRHRTIQMSGDQAE